MLLKGISQTLQLWHQVEVPQWWVFALWYIYYCYFSSSFRVLLPIDTAALNMFKILTNQQAKILIVLLLILVIGCYIYQSINQHGHFLKTNKETHTCEFYRERLKKLSFLAQTTHDLFELNALHHFLFYGSIWGVLRGYKGPLPWDYDIDFATIYTDDTGGKMDIICKSLLAKNISCSYDSSGASYKIRLMPVNKHEDVQVDLFLLVPTWHGYMRRLGWEIWLLPLHYYLHHSFPAYLVDGDDLPIVEFAGRNISSPKDGVEIMKYLYRSTWKSVLKPKYTC